MDRPFCETLKACRRWKADLGTAYQSIRCQTKSTSRDVVGEVHPNGTVHWDVDMPQVPFDFDKLQDFGAERCDEVIVETTRIPNAYITK